MACPNCGKKNRVPASATGTPRCANCKHALPWIVDATDRDFDEVATRSTLPVLLDLWAPWCGPCRMVSPALESLARENAGSLKLVKVNVDEAPAIAQRFDARSIPTLAVLRDGKVVARQVGAAPEHALRQWLTGALADRS
jgi:thioredoxin 2